MSKETQNWMHFSGIGIQLVITILVFLWIGMKLENYLIIKVPYGQLLGAFIGIFASLYKIIKSINNV